MKLRSSNRRETPRELTRAQLEGVRGGVGLNNNPAFQDNAMQGAMPSAGVMVNPLYVGSEAEATNPLYV